MSPLFVLAGFFAAIVGVIAAGCPQTECAYLTDCPPGELCDPTGRCVTDTTVLPPPHDAGPGGDGGPGYDAGPGTDGGPNEDLRVPLIEQINAPATAIMRDPADANTALVAMYTTGGGLDQLNELDIAAHQITNSPRLDFLNIAGGCCVDELHFFPDQAPLQLPRGDEYWFSCMGAGGSLIHYEDVAFAQSYRDATIDEIDLVTLVDSGVDTNGDARVVFAKRGDTELKVVRFEPTNQEHAPRDIETVASDVTFDAIAGLFTVVEGHDEIGDLVLVFDRGAAGTLPRLVPVQRNYGQLTWHGPPMLNSQIDTITLPAGTHGALFRTDPGIPDPRQLTTSNADQDVPNVLLTLPIDGVGGRAMFFRYERESGRNLDEVSPLSGFAEVQLAGASMPAALPSAEDKLLLREISYGERAFAYVLTNAAIGFVIPLPSSRNVDVTDQVKRGAFQSTADRPSSYLPLSASRMLIGFSGKNELHQVGFSDRF